MTNAKMLLLWALAALCGVLGYLNWVSDRALLVQRTAIVPSAKVLALSSAVVASEVHAPVEPTPPLALPPISQTVANPADQPAASPLVGRSVGYQALFSREKQNQRRVELLYGNLIETLALPPETLERLKDVLVRRESAIAEAARKAAKDGVRGDNPAFWEAERRAAAAFDNTLVDLLGSVDYERLAALLPLARANGVAQEAFGPQMAFEGVPLSKEQTLGLARAMYAVGYYPGATNYLQRSMEPADPATGMNPLVQALIERATVVLTPAQLRIIQEQHRLRVAARLSPNRPPFR